MICPYFGPASSVFIVHWGGGTPSVKPGPGIEERGGGRATKRAQSVAPLLDFSSGDKISCGSFFGALTVGR